MADARTADIRRAEIFQCYARRCSGKSVIASSAADVEAIGLNLPWSFFERAAISDKRPSTATFPASRWHCAFILPQGLFCVFPPVEWNSFAQAGGKLAARPARSPPSIEALFSSPAASFTFSLSRNSRCLSPPYNR